MPTRPRRPTRNCLHEGCQSPALRNHGYCRNHRTSPEAVALRKQVRSAATLLLDDPESLAATEAAAKREAFERRAKRGDFNALLGAAMNTMFEKADSERDYQREIGMLRYSMVKSIALEDDPHKMALTVARCANAIAKTTLTRHITKEPEPEPERPYWEYARTWQRPVEREALVQYIWRHRPKDFEERYMTHIDQDEIPADLDARILAEFAAVDNSDHKVDRTGKFNPVPASDTLRAEVLNRSGVELPPNPEPPAVEEYEWILHNYQHKSPEWWENPDQPVTEPIVEPFESAPDPEWDDQADLAQFNARYSPAFPPDPPDNDENEDLEYESPSPRLARGRR